MTQLVQDPVLESCCNTTEAKVSSCECGSLEQVNLAEVNESRTFKSKLRSGVLFVVACLTSPCCTPLYVPLVLGLLAGTPIAIWLSANVGLVYGFLTLLSVVSFVLAFRRWPRSKAKQYLKLAESKIKRIKRSL